MRPTRHLLPLAFVLPACASSDDTPPVLEVTTPERGTLAESATVTVTGTVTDDAPGRLRVLVNGVEASLAPGGAFTATVDLAPGVEILETIAIDGGDNRARDVRAVLAGTLAPADGAVADAMGVRVGASGFRAIGQIAGDTVSQMDLTQAVQPMNPVFEDPGCLGARVDVTSVDVGDVDIALGPQAGAIGIGVTVTDLEVRLHADYEVACVGGSSNLVVRASEIRMTGGLGLDVVDGDLRAAVHDLSLVIEGFDLDAGGIPGAIVDLIDDVIDDRVAEALENVIRDQVPGMVESALADLTGKTWSVPLLGTEVGVTVRPTDIDLEADGTFIAVDTALRVAGGEGGAYLSTPSPVSSTLMDGTDGFGLAVADDAINQLFAGLWAAGALDQSLPLEEGHPLGLLLDEKTALVEASMSLPPTVSMAADGGLRFALGDAVITCRDAAGEELSRIALSVRAAIRVETSDAGALRMKLGEPEVFAQVLWQSETLEHPMDGGQVEDLVRAVWELAASAADGALENLPLPSIGGVTLDAPSVETESGFVVVQAGVSIAP